MRISEVYSILAFFLLVINQEYYNVYALLEKSIASNHKIKKEKLVHVNGVLRVNLVFSSLCLVFLINSFNGLFLLIIFFYE